ncbi:hypothetical protein GGF42_008086 [Coemansia sp. RSA 2424]|nr:hypothetical protein GGF42_008086 [Coemansia sp. RSA 2424]
MKNAVNRLLFRAMESTTVVLKRSRVSVRIECPSSIASEYSLAQIQQFPALTAWLQSLDDQVIAKPGSDISIKTLSIQSVDGFKNGKIGFIKFSTDAHCTSSGRRIPGIVFLRGGSAAVLVILRTAEQATGSSKALPSHVDTDYVVMVEQPRVAVPRLALQELPAGMLDDNDDSGAAAAVAGVSTAVREVLEETGIRINAGDLIRLTADGRALYPSPGACDESVELYACEKRVSGEELAALRGRLGGLADEHITVRLVRVCDVWRHTTDMKALAALYLWDRRASERQK